MKDSFIFYRSFFEAINDLDNETQLQLFKAISEYSLNFKEIELSGVASTIFRLIKPQLDANIKRFNNGLSPKKQKVSKKQAKPKQKVSKQEANKNDNVNVNNNVNKNVNVNAFVLAELEKDGDVGKDPKYTIPNCLVELWEEKNGKDSDDAMFAKYENFYAYWNCELPSKPSDPYKINWRKTWLNQITRQ